MRTGPRTIVRLSGSNISARGDNVLSERKASNEVRMPRTLVRMSGWVHPSYFFQKPYKSKNNPQGMLTPASEPPLYVLPQNKSRVLIPKVASLTILGAIFYSGILLNLSLIQLTPEEQSIANLASLIFLFFIVVLGIYLGYHQSSQPYLFYRDGVIVRKKKVIYSSVVMVQKKQDILDKIFKTYHLDLGNKTSLSNIPEGVQADAYLQQMINYSRNFAR